MAAKLSSTIQKLVDDGRLPGVGAVSIDKTGKSIYNEAFGKINGPDSSNFTNDTPMLFWSCTKFLTSICVLQLLEKGKISSIDDPVSKYLPNQGKVKVIVSNNKDGPPETRDPKGQITIIQLLTHTSGYTYDFWDQLMFDYRQTKSQPQGTYVGLGADWQFNDVFLEFDPGARHNYGINIDILGFVVEELSGMSLPDYIKKNVTDPLGMTNTGPYLTGDSWLRTHVKSPEGAVTPVEAIVPATEPDKFGGGHYIVSTLNDYSQVLLAMLNEGKHPKTGKSVLSPETVRNYVFKDFIPHVGCSPDGIGRCPATLVPGLGNAGEMLEGEKKGWSAGLMINLNDIQGKRRANSGAWAGLGNIYYWIDPTAGKAGVFATNVLPFFDKDSMNVFDQFEEFTYSA